MSPTMTEGGIASWKKEEGESFAQGDVLLEIVSLFSGERDILPILAVGTDHPLCRPNRRLTKLLLTSKRKRMV